jgi:lysozyme family protein
MIDDPIFIASCAKLLKHEGGFQNARADRGNWTSGVVGQGELKGTKYGISAAQYSTLDIANLTEDDAQAIYYRDWWVRYELGKLNPPIAGKMLDTMVPMGPFAAVKCLQRAIRGCGGAILEDGVLGTVTMTAANLIPPATLLPALRVACDAHYLAVVQANPSDAPFLKDWRARAYDEI